jgi:AcrR family transcriptional regulator
VSPRACPVLNVSRSPSPLTPKASSGSSSSADHKGRLLDALSRVLTMQPYAEITIADIVAQAHVSKRTFYEQFASKEACLLALCALLSEQTLQLIAAGYDPQEDWVAQLHSITHTYLNSLQQQPALVRTLYIELLTIGPEGLAMRRQIGQRFADFLIVQVELVRQREPGKRPLSPAMAMAIVGGVNELILHAIEEGRADRLAELTAPVTAFVQAVLQSLEPAQSSSTPSA